MKLVHCLVISCLSFTSCVAWQQDVITRSWRFGIERINARHKSDHELEMRLSQVEHELNRSQYGEGAWYDINVLGAERDAIVRELLHRYETGDRDAYLPQFGP